MIEAEIPSIVPVPTVAVAPAAATVLAEFRAELAELGAEVDRVRQDVGFRRALDTAARFWRYSPCNQWLIQIANPRSTRVPSVHAREQARRGAARTAAAERFDPLTSYR